MSKLFYAFIFCFFLLFQTNSLAQEDTNATAAQSPQNELTQAEQEAQAAEAAELREAGVEEEPKAE